MLASNNRLTYSLREILAGSLLTMLIYIIIAGNSLINSILHSENQYPAKIHNQILSLLLPLRTIRISETKINQSINPLSIELHLDKATRISELDMIFSQKITKDITVYFNVNDSWIKVKDLRSEESSDLKIIIDPDKREKTSLVKIEFSNISPNDNPIYFNIVHLLRPLRHR